MNKLHPFLFVITLCSVVTVRAQELVKFPAGPGAWTVDIVSKSKVEPGVETEDKLVQVKKIDITQVGGLCRNLITWSNGKTTERWSSDSLSIMIGTDTHNGDPAILSGEDISLGGEFAVGFNAASFNWLKEELLQETGAYNGKKCHHYKGTITVDRRDTAGTESRKVTLTLHCEAWIDQETLLPVAYYDGAKLGLFTFHAPPTGPLNPPPSIKSALEHYAAAMQPLK